MASPVDWDEVLRDIRAGKARILSRGARARLPTVSVTLDGGPHDGATYNVPAVYPGGDGLPDAIVLADHGGAVYLRNTGSMIYCYTRTRDGIPPHAHHD